MSGIVEQLDALRATGLEQIEAAQDPEDLEAVRVSLLGKKGSLTTLLKRLRRPNPIQRQ